MISINKKQEKTIMQLHSALMESKQQKLPLNSAVKSKLPKFKKGERKKQQKFTRMHRDVVSKAVKAVRIPALRLAQAQKELALAKAGYFDVKDTKTPAPDLENLRTTIENATKEIALIKQTMSSALGNRPVKFRLSQTINITTTVTSGITRTVTLTSSAGTRTDGAVSPQYCDEWAQLLLLFDEYRCFGGQSRVGYFNASTAAALNGNTSNSIPVISFDPEDSTLPTSSLLMTQLAQHQLWEPTFSNVDYHPNGKDQMWHDFKYHVPGMLVEPGAGTQSLEGNQWTPIVEPAVHGYLKFYHIGQIVTATITGTGINYVNCAFRCRA